MMEEISIPEFIDAPPQVFIWDFDDMAPVLAGVAMGAIVLYVSDSILGFMACVFVGVIMSYYYIKFKRNRLPGTLAHILYCYTGLIPLNKRFNNGLLQRTNE